MKTSDFIDHFSLNCLLKSPPYFLLSDLFHNAHFHRTIVSRGTSLCFPQCCLQLLISVQVKPPSASSFVLEDSVVLFVKLSQGSKCPCRRMIALPPIQVITEFLFMKLPCKQGYLGKKKQTIVVEGT